VTPQYLVGSACKEHWCGRAEGDEGWGYKKYDGITAMPCVHLTS